MVNWLFWLFCFIISIGRLIEIKQIVFVVENWTNRWMCICDICSLNHRIIEHSLKANDESDCFVVNIVFSDKNSKISSVWFGQMSVLLWWSQKWKCSEWRKIILINARGVRLKHTYIAIWNMNSNLMPVFLFVFFFFFRFLRGKFHN